MSRIGGELLFLGEFGGALRPAVGWRPTAVATLLLATAMELLDELHGPD